MSNEKKKDNTGDYSIYLEEDSYVPSEVENVKNENNETPKETETKIETKENQESVKTPEKQKKSWWSNRSKSQKIIAIVVAIILVLLIGVGAFIWSKLNLVDTDGEDNEVTAPITDDLDLAEMNGITDAVSLNDFLKKWATNGGDKMSSKNVKNILLVGTRDGLSDSMMLISLNESTKQMTLVSFYRDSYTYIQPDGKKPLFKKLNHAYAYGGIKCLIKTIEDNYKIKIDDYVKVDTNSFVKVIDALGGVNVNVTEKEANYLNSTWRKWTFTGNPVSFKAGVNKLNGEKALMFSRIREIGTDIGRTERQRRVITSIISTFKNASLSQMNSAINALLPNIKTGMSKGEIVGYASDAISSGWMSYPISQTTMPTLETGKGATVKTEWVWLVDYELSAYQLQMALYGKSNINLSPDRKSPIDLKPAATVNSNTSSPTSNKNNTQKPTQSVSQNTEKVTQGSEKPSVSATENQVTDPLVTDNTQEPTVPTVTDNGTGTDG